MVYKYTDYTFYKLEFEVVSKTQKHVPTWFRYRKLIS